MNWLKLSMSIFLIAGLVMFYVSIEEHKKINHLLKSGVEVDAVVVDPSTSQTVIMVPRTNQSLSTRTGSLFVEKRRS